jgi:hypothetical protein
MQISSRLLGLTAAPFGENASLDGLGGHAEKP